MIKHASYLILILLIFAAATVAVGQTTEFTFQGRLLDNTLPPTASYDFEFRLFDAEESGNELGSDAQLGVAVNAGAFSVRLDFGKQFDGTPRFLQIGVRPAGSPEPFTILDPRQPISSTPYAIRSLNAAAAETASNASQLGGVDAAEYVQDDDERLTDARSPTAGSPNYVQNRTTQQSAANFNISGTGIANIFSAGTQFNIGGNRILGSPGTLNTFVGINNGLAVTSGERNTFVGRNTGVNTTTGSTNTFVGSGAGYENISGSQNSFFGYNAGLRVTGGSRNSYFGVSVGGANLTGVDNSMFGYESGLNATGSGSSFFGYEAGRHTTTAANNSFFGRRAGRENTAGGYNVFLGALTGEFNTVGNFNTFVGAFGGNGNLSGTNNTVLGYGANVGAADLTYATAIGAGSVVPTSNTIQLGRSNGADRVFVPGVLDAPSIVSDNPIAINSNNGVILTSIGGSGNISFHSDNVIYLEGAHVDLLPGTRFRVRTMTTGTYNEICANGDGYFGWCASSSLRYKKNVADLASASSIIGRLRPVTFDWISSDEHDIGLVAEEVAAVEPLLAIYNKDGEVEGVKYNRIGVVLINVVKEQQEQIEAQQMKIEEQEAQIRAMRTVICELMPGAKICSNQAAPNAQEEKQ